ncbi:MAG: N-6 DNA methylase [Chloroflexi bacterium]|nr:N-6 DNA methylase [Chloroflexota bacterium]
MTSAAVMMLLTTPQIAWAFTQVAHLAEPFDVVLTNPPFSMTKEKKKEADRRILAQYRMAHQNPTSGALRSSLRSNIMFMERYADLVRPGGRFLTVIDDTLLASDVDVFRATRNFLREHFLVRGIISLPSGAFRRQGSRVKTSILVMEKKHSASENQPACYGFFAEKLGVDDLAPRASRADIEEARDAANEEIEVILREYRQYLDGERVERGVVLPSDQLQDRLDLKSCAPELGRMADEWRAGGAELKLFRQCVTPVTEVVSPAAHPEQEFKLLKVSYDGRCIVERERKGDRIRARTMHRVREGQMVFSIIRATDGAIGIVPPELDGALVSPDSFMVFACATPQDTHYLRAVLRSHELRADMQAKSTGSGRYVTAWPDVGDWLHVPWLPDDERRQVGDGLMEALELERQADAQRRDAMERIHALGVESKESVIRWERSKAPR